MIRPASLFIGLRYTRAKRRNHFVSFISLVSIIGIALGVAALITVLSVMNGFDYQMRQQLFSFEPAVTVTTNDNISQTWRQLSKKLGAYPDVTGTAPFVSGKGMLTNEGLVSGVETLGVLPSQESKVSELPKHMVVGKFSSLKPGIFNMVIGSKLATSLGLIVGNKVSLLTPQTTSTPFGIMPRYRQFTVSGVFTTGSGFGFDTSVAYINMKDAERLYLSGQSVGGLHLRLKNIYQAQEVTNKIQKSLPMNYFVSNWTQTYGALFKALAMEKTMMFVILLLIVGVAAFNLVATLMMTVNDKRGDIAVLRTLGASPRNILMIFVVQGALVGMIGVLIGVVGGVLLALNATDIVNWVQHTFGVQFLSSSVYFVNFLPSRLQWTDVLNISLWAWGLSIIATLYPAWVGSKTQPAEALRYE
jgi:lipoprotein-releasing system permease protein